VRPPGTAREIFSAEPSASRTSDSGRPCGSMDG
jgi:hypothetical protein